MDDQPTRLFDLPDYQLRRFPQSDMLSVKQGGEWIPYSTAQVCALVSSLAAGLLKIGIGHEGKSVETSDKVAIISANRPEWIIADQACQRVGAVVVPIYPTLNARELCYILKQASVKLVFAGDADLAALTAAASGGLEEKPAVVTFDELPGLTHWKTICTAADEAAQAELDRIAASVTPSHVATIIFTSGTTGEPKGVMLTHHNILSNVIASYPYLPVTARSRALSFLPLNHVYERMIDYLYIYSGVSIYYAESMDTIAANIREIRPHIFTTVPRLLEKVYERITEKGMALSGIQKRLFDWSIALGLRYEINTSMGWWYDLQLSVARRLVFSKWREALGGNVQAIVTGSAACQVRLLKLFTAAGVNILEGYGLTETSPVISVNRMEVKDRMFGTVGPAIQGVELKIAPDGEILCKGPNVMAGYYLRDDLTAEVIEDGWFHTGDIGELKDGRFLKITDRKKELFKTSGGKYVAPQPIENKMKESPYIAEIMVVGANRKFPSALIVPDFKNLKSWCASRSLAWDDDARLVELPEVHALYKQEVDRGNEPFSHVEQVKKFVVMPAQWTIDTGELSQTLKLKRKTILEKYAGLIDGMYS